MVVALILVSIALALTLGMLLFGNPRGAATSPDVQQKLDAASKARSAAETELDKKRRELEEQRTQLADAREQLKQAKRKLFEQKEGDKGDRDLTKARADVERNASLQLEHVRAELATALTELQRIKSGADTVRTRRSTSVPSMPAVAAAPQEPTQPSQPSQPAERRYRELTDADRQKMERLEHQASKDRARTAEAEKELRRLKGRSETQHRIYVVTKGELDLVKDKFKALEKRLNRTLLERDLLRRAIKDLEKKTGTNAERTELTAEEIAASDQKVEERTSAEAAEKRAAELKLQAEAEAAAAEPTLSNPGTNPGLSDATQPSTATDEERTVSPSGSSPVA